MRVIRGLKQEMGRHKNMMESPDYGQNLTVHPSESTRLYLTREYLERAKQANAEACRTYTLSKSEQKADDFDANMHSISKITFIIGGYFDGYRSYVVELTDGLKAYIKLWEDEELLKLWDDGNEEPFTKETFIYALKDLHIGEWRRRYSTERFGYTVCDGTQWELEFEYNMFIIQQVLMVTTHTLITSISSRGYLALITLGRKTRMSKFDLVKGRFNFGYKQDESFIV